MRSATAPGISVNITFEQSLGTKNDDNDYTQWIAKFSSETFDNQRFGGTMARVSELITYYIEKIIEQTLEACIANAEEWYKDKPEVKDEVYALHGALKELCGAS